MYISEYKVSIYTVYIIANKFFKIYILWISSLDIISLEYLHA